MGPPGLASLERGARDQPRKRVRVVEQPLERLGVPPRSRVPPDRGPRLGAGWREPPPGRLVAALSALGTRAQRFTTRLSGRRRRGTGPEHEALAERVRGEAVRA